MFQIQIQIYSNFTQQMSQLKSKNALMYSKSEHVNTNFKFRTNQVLTNLSHKVNSSTVYVTALSQHNGTKSSEN